MLCKKLLHCIFICTVFHYCIVTLYCFFFSLNILDWQLGGCRTLQNGNHRCRGPVIVEHNYYADDGLELDKVSTQTCLSLPSLKPDVFPRSAGHWILSHTSKQRSFETGEHGCS